jgi:poly(3-hydroxybutyrate) depolymerase
VCGILCTPKRHRQLTSRRYNAGMAIASRPIGIVILFALLVGTPARAQSITKETFEVDRAKRTYYMFVPDSAGSDPVPLVIALHGSGRDGRPLVELLRTIATKERFIVVGPDAIDRRGWQVPADGPALFYDLIEAVKAKHPVDGRRIYLFGHSAGASFALSMGLMESDYFAGVAAHAVAMPEEGRDRLLALPHTRTLPIAIFHGTKDETIPIANALRTRDLLIKAGFPVDFHELPGYEHNSIYGRGDSILQPAWEFLKSHTLDADPRYQAYSYQKR